MSMIRKYCVANRGVANYIRPSQKIMIIYFFFILKTSPHRTFWEYFENEIFYQRGVRALIS